MEIWEGVSLKLILVGYCCNRQYFRLPFCWSGPEDWSILQKWGVENGGAWNGGYKHLCAHVLKAE